MGLKESEGNIWDMSEEEMERYSQLTLTHQAYLPWLFFNYENEAWENVTHIKRAIGILLKPRKYDKQVWLEHFEWSLTSERARHFMSNALSIESLGLLFFPFFSQKKEHELFCDMVIDLISKQVMPVKLFPWQLEGYQLSRFAVDAEKIKLLSDERSRLHLYMELEKDKKIQALLDYHTFKQAVVGKHHLSMCVQIWGSYLECLANQHAIPSSVIYTPSSRIDLSALTEVQLELEKPQGSLIEEALEKCGQIEKSPTQENIDRWCEKVEKYYSPTGKYKFHGEICLKIAGEEGFKKSAAYIANKTREVFRKISGKTKPNT